MCSAITGVNVYDIVEVDRSCTSAVLSSVTSMEKLSF